MLFRANEFLQKALHVRRPGSLVAAVALFFVTPNAARAQADSAIILTIPSLASAAKCSTTVMHPEGGITVSLTLAAGPFSDTRMVIGTFDTSGHPRTLRDAAFRVNPPLIESATVQFDSTGAARGGVGQYLTQNDFSKDSTGALRPRLDRPSFRALTRAKLAQAEKVSKWLWSPECRSVKPRNPETR